MGVVGWCDLRAWFVGVVVWLVGVVDACAQRASRDGDLAAAAATGAEEVDGDKAADQGDEDDYNRDVDGLGQLGGSGNACGGECPCLVGKCLG